MPGGRTLFGKPDGGSPSAATAEDAALEFLYPRYGRRLGSTASHPQVAEGSAGAVPRRAEAPSRMSELASPQTP